MLTRTQTMGKIVPFACSDQHIEVLWVKTFRLRLVIWLYLLHAHFNYGSTLDLHNQDPKLTAVPVNLKTNIVHLDLRNNHIALLGPDSFPGLTAVTTMDLSHNRITHIDNLAFQSCESLVDLIIEFNKITAMPSSFGPNSNNMRKLAFGNNPCFLQPPLFEQFRSLERLSMEHLSMTDLPNDLFNGLQNLRFIRLRGTGAPNLTDRTPKLETLWVHNFPGSSFPDENVRNLAKLTSFQFSGRGTLETVPRFEESIAVTEIIIAGARVEALPDFSHMQNLTKFYFNPFALVCDQRMCWTAFESYTFSLGYLDTFGCMNPSKFRGRKIREISKLELACYDSKTVIILGMGSDNTRRRMDSVNGRRLHFVTSSLIDWAHTQNVVRLKLT